MSDAIEKNEEGTEETEVEDKSQEEKPETEDGDGAEKETETVTPEEDLIELADGTKVTAKELVDGYLRQSDYTKKTQTLAEERRKLESAMVAIGEKKVEKTDDSPKAKSKYKPEQLEELKVVLNDLGYVSKHELSAMTEKQKREEIINGFFAKHPEYAVENDPGDVKISAFRGELALYNHSDLSVLPRALEKAHEAIASKFNLDKERETQIANKLKSKASTVGSGGGQKTPASTEKRYTREQIKVMQEMGLYENEEPID